MQCSLKFKLTKVVFSEAILGILKCKAFQATYSVKISLNHDILRYMFNGRGKSSADGMCMIYKESDFKKLCLPHFWHCYLDQLGQGVSIKFPLKLKPIVRFSKKAFDWWSW